MEKKTEYVVKMAPNHQLTLYPACGTCEGDKPGVGYLCGSDEEGNGFIVWITDKDVYEAMKKHIPLG